MTITATDVGRITADIFASMLGIELSEETGTRDPTDRLVTGMVSIAGDWQGTVTIEMSEALAIIVAGTMFGMTPDELTADEIHDAVGEMANMTGGNVKCMVEGSCSLSLPSVTSGLQYQVDIPGAVVRERVERSYAGQPVIVTLLEPAR